MKRVVHMARQTSNGPVIFQHMERGPDKCTSSVMFPRPEYTHVEAALVTAWLNGRDSPLQNMLPEHLDPYMRPYQEFKPGS